MKAPAISIIFSLLLTLAALGCSLLINTDLEEGYPCEVDGRCLDGFRCSDGICVGDAADPSFDPCGGECTALERCDRDTGQCLPICQGVICASGEVCRELAGGCIPAASGVGKLCRRDADCQDILPGCSGDGLGVAAVHCACVVPMSMAATGDVQGVCLGLPAVDDCAACEGASCVSATLTSGGPGGGLWQRRVCAPPGFAACGNESDCLGSSSPTTCTYLGWPESEGSHEWHEALLSACSTPSWRGTLAAGEDCTPEDPLECLSGICMPSAGDRHVCTGPCRGDLECSGDMPACVDALVKVAADQVTLYQDVAPVCGTGPSLGLDCQHGVASTCGTDAPYCITDEDGTFCTRYCTRDSHCDADVALECLGAPLGYCWPPIG